MNLRLLLYQNELPGFRPLEKCAWHSQQKDFRLIDNHCAKILQNKPFTQLWCQQRPFQVIPHIDENVQIHATRTVVIRIITASLFCIRPSDSANSVLQYTNRVYGLSMSLPQDASSILYCMGILYPYLANSHGQNTYRTAAFYGPALPPPPHQAMTHHIGHNSKSNCPHLP